MILTFQNFDAGKTDTLDVKGIPEVKLIYQWYGAFFAGDDYVVTLDGVPIPVDQNGETSTELSVRLVKLRAKALLAEGEVYRQVLKDRGIVENETLVSVDDRGFIKKRCKVWVDQYGFLKACPVTAKDPTVLQPHFHPLTIRPENIK
jgi:hypothetical protein